MPRHRPERLKRKIEESNEEPPKKKEKKKEAEKTNSKGMTVNKILWRYRNPPKQWPKTSLGKHNQLESNRERKALMNKNAALRELEFIEVYDKAEVVKSLEATELADSDGTAYHMKDGGDAIFITFTEDPKNDHMCSWNNMIFGVNKNVEGMVVATFARGKHIKGTTLAGEKYIYLGLVSTHRKRMDWSLNRKAINEIFGKQILKCKINRYGMSMCIFLNIGYAVIKKDTDGEYGGDEQKDEES